jgi:hypothetical protein
VEGGRIRKEQLPVDIRGEYSCKLAVILKRIKYGVLSEAVKEVPQVTVL